MLWSLYASCFLTRAGTELQISGNNFRGNTNSSFVGLKAKTHRHIQKYHVQGTLNGFYQDKTVIDRFFHANFGIDRLYSNKSFFTQIHYLFDSRKGILNQYHILFGHGVAVWGSFSGKKTLRLSLGLGHRQTKQKDFSWRRRSIYSPRIKFKTLWDKLRLTTSLLFTQAIGNNTDRQWHFDLALDHLVGENLVFGLDYSWKWDNIVSLDKKRLDQILKYHITWQI